MHSIFTVNICNTSFHSRFITCSTYSNICKLQFNLHRTVFINGVNWVALLHKYIHILKQTVPVYDCLHVIFLWMNLPSFDYIYYLFVTKPDGCLYKVTDSFKKLSACIFSKLWYSVCGFKIITKYYDIMIYAYVV
jgi:hypothetical protein